MSPAVMPILSLLVDLFRRRRMIREDVLPLVESAARGELSHEKRREIVVAALMGRGLAESEARLLTEAGVRLYKRHQKKAAKRAARKARRAGIVAPDRPATLHRPDLGEPPE